MMHVLSCTTFVYASLRQPRLARCIAMRRHASRFAPSFDPYSYSRGSWLDRDEKRQKARRLDFNFDALLAAAVNCSIGAREVVACEKREGGFNRVFVFELGNGAKVVAKVPMRFAGPSTMVTISEVATMKYVRDKTSVPVPRVLAWNSKCESGSVGTECIIMEQVSGVALNDTWNQMTELQQIEFIESMAGLVKELSSFDFGAFGSLYLNTAEKPSEAQPIDEEYCIGPHCGRQFWGYNDDLTIQAAVPPGLRGPWQGLSTFFADLTRISRMSVDQRESPRKDVEQYLRLLESSRQILAVVEDATTLKDACSPLLLHPDLHARNVFVDPNDPKRILGLIDWQSAAIEPAFVHTDGTPDFAEELLLDKTLDAGDSHGLHDIQRHARRRKRTWDVLVSLFPKLGKATAMNPALSRYLAGVSFGYGDELNSLRSLLTEVSDHWNELDFLGACPYQSSQEDGELLSMELDELESTHRLRAYLSRLLRCEMDGWVEEARWNKVLPIYRKQYAEFVSACIAGREDEATEQDAEEKANKLWPFDMR